MFRLINKNIHGEPNIAPNMPAYTWIPTVLVAEATLASPSRIHRAPRTAAQDRQLIEDYPPQN